MASLSGRLDLYRKLWLDLEIDFSLVSTGHLAHLTVCAYKVWTGRPVESAGLFLVGQSGSSADRGMHSGNPVAERTLGLSASTVHRG